MRPNVGSTRETLNVEALPPTEGMELDYRSQPFPEEDYRHMTRSSLMAWSVLAVFLSLGVGTAAAFISTWLFLAVSLLVGMALAFVAWHMAARDVPDIDAPGVAPVTNPVRASGWLLVGPCCWFAAVLYNQIPLVLLMAVPLAASLCVAHRITLHYGRWLHTNPFVPRRARIAWLRSWPITSVCRELHFMLLSPKRHFGDGALQSERAERMQYAVGHAVVLLAYLAAIAAYLVTPGRSAPMFAALCVFFVLLFAYGFWNVSRYPQRSSLRATYSNLRDAVVSYFTYNFHETPAPGVFQSPFGPRPVRLVPVRLLVFVAPVIILPAIWYLPLVPTMAGDEPWLRAMTPRFIFAEPSTPQASDQPPPGLAPYMTPKDREAYAAAAHEAKRRRSLRARLYRSPEAFIGYTFVGAFLLEPVCMISLFASVLLSMAVAPLLIAAVYFAVCGRVLTHFHCTLEGNGETPALYHSTGGGSEWQAYVQRIRQSKCVSRDFHGATHRECDQLLVGFNVLSDYPVLVSPGILAEHVHILGDSGSGKSARGLAPLIHQLIGRPNTSVIVFDLKATDISLLEESRHSVEAHNYGKPKANQVHFKWFTNQSGASTHIFNPFLQAHLAIDQMDSHAKAELMIQALGLDYGEGYGQYFFSSANRQLLQKFIQHDPAVASFRDLRQAFSNLKYLRHDLGLSHKEIENASHLKTVVEALSPFDALNFTPQDAAEYGLPANVMGNAIDMSTAVRQREVIHFHLPAILGQSSVREIAKLALYCLLVAAERRGPSNHTVYVVIDEFQQLLSDDLHILFRMARSSNIPLIVANQTMSDLRSGGTDLIPTVEGNTRMRQIFSCSDRLHQDTLIKSCDEVAYHSERWEERPSVYGRGLSYAENTKVRGGMGAKFRNWFGLLSAGDEDPYEFSSSIGPRLRRNDLIEASDHPDLSVLQITRGHGFTQYGGKSLIMRTCFHIDEKTYKKRMASKWPKTLPDTIVAPLKNPEQQQEELFAQMDPLTPELIDEIQQKLDSLE